MKPWIYWAGLFLVGIGLGWFLSDRTTGGETDAAAVSGEGGSQIHHDIAGTIVRLAPEDGVMTVDHEAIDGFMPAMVMDIPLADPGELAAFSPGDAILFDLVSIGSDLQAVRLRPADGAAPTSMYDRDPENPLGRGDLVPDLDLYDTAGKRFRLGEMEQRHKIVTFFYIRCPLQDFCPTQSQRLAQLQEHVARTPGGVHLVSLSLDSENDSAADLAEYAERFGAEPERWTLAGGENAEAIREFADRAGARIMRDDGSPWIDHALIAVRLDGDRIVDLVYGLDAIEGLVRAM